MLSKQGETPSWDDEDFSDRRSCASVKPSGTPVRRSARLSWASDATSHEGDQRARSPAANSPRKKGSRRAGIWSQVSARFSAGRRSSRGSNASAASSDMDGTKKVKGVWARARLEARRAASSQARRSWRNSALAVQRRTTRASRHSSRPWPRALAPQARGGGSRQGSAQSRQSRRHNARGNRGFGKTAVPPLLGSAPTDERRRRRRQAAGRFGNWPEGRADAGVAPRRQPQAVARRAR